MGCGPLAELVGLLWLWWRQALGSGGKSGCGGSRGRSGGAGAAAAAAAGAAAGVGPAWGGGSAVVHLASLAGAAAP